MTTRQRKNDSHMIEHRLERRHSDLAMRVADLNARIYLSEREQTLLSSLKREKLAAKDALTVFRRTN
jgi:hypothetical protein